MGVLTSAALGTLREYLSTADVIGTDDYTISDGAPPQVALGSAEQMDAIRKQTDSAVPVWDVLQMNNMKVYHKVRAITMSLFLTFLNLVCV